MHMKFNNQNNIVVSEQISNRKYADKSNCDT